MCRIYIARAARMYRGVKFKPSARRVKQEDQDQTQRGENSRIYLMAGDVVSKSDGGVWVTRGKSRW